MKEDFIENIIGFILIFFIYSIFILCLYIIIIGINNIEEDKKIRKENLIEMCNKNNNKIETQIYKCLVGKTKYCSEYTIYTINICHNIEKYYELYGKNIKNIKE